MANLCATYLTFECFSTSMQETDLRENVEGGAFAFQEYATLNWLYHLKTSSNRNMSDDNGELASLTRACQVLESRHCGMPLHKVEPSNSDHGRQGRQKSAPALAQIQEGYEAVHSISDSEECYRNFHRPF